MMVRSSYKRNLCAGPQHAALLIALTATFFILFTAAAPAHAAPSDAPTTWTASTGKDLPTSLGAHKKRVLLVRGAADAVHTDALHAVRAALQGHALLVLDDAVLPQAVGKADSAVLTLTQRQPVDLRVLIRVIGPAESRTAVLSVYDHTGALQSAVSLNETRRVWPNAQQPTPVQSPAARAPVETDAQRGGSIDKRAAAKSVQAAQARRTKRQRRKQRRRRLDDDRFDPTPMHPSYIHTAYLTNGQRRVPVYFLGDDPKPLSIFEVIDIVDPEGEERRTGLAVGGTLLGLGSTLGILGGVVSFRSAPEPSTALLIGSAAIGVGSIAMWVGLSKEFEDFDEALEKHNSQYE